MTSVSGCAVFVQSYLGGQGQMKNIQSSCGLILQAFSPITMPYLKNSPGTLVYTLHNPETSMKTRKKPAHLHSGTSTNVDMRSNECTLAIDCRTPTTKQTNGYGGILIGSFFYSVRTNSEIVLDSCILPQLCSTAELERRTKTIS